MGNFSITINGSGSYDTPEFRQAIYGFLQNLTRLKLNISQATAIFGGHQDFLRNFVSREIVVDYNSTSIERSES